MPPSAPSATRFEPKNPYETLNKKYLLPQAHYPHEKDVNVRLSTRIEVIAMPGKRKTAWVFWFLTVIVGLKNITNLLCFAAEMPSDPLYQCLEEEASKAGCNGIFGTNLDAICACEDEEVCDKLHVRDIDPSETTFLILDDMVSKDKKVLSVLNHWYIASRRSNVTTICVTQNHTSLPVLWRRCTDYYVVKCQGMNEDDLSRMLMNFTAKQNVHLIIELYRKICGTGDLNNFLFCDPNNADKSLRYRFNFRKTVIPGLM